MQTNQNSEVENKNQITSCTAFWRHMVRSEDYSCIKNSQGDTILCSIPINCSVHGKEWIGLSCLLMISLKLKQEIITHK